MVRTIVRDGMHSIRDMWRRDVLAAVGLDYRPSLLEAALPAAGLFVAGALLGSGIALLFAPKSGRDLRRQIGRKTTDLAQQIESAAGKVLPGGTQTERPEAHQTH